MLFMGKSTISMAMFNSYVDITRGYIPLNPIKPPFSYGFPMVYQHIHSPPLKSGSAEDEGTARCSFPVDGVGVDENGTPMAEGKGAARIPTCFWKTRESN